MLTTFLAAGTILALATTAPQASLTGKWEGKTPNGMTVVLVLKATDTEVTGTLHRVDDDVKAEITDGKVTKNTFTFKVILGEQTESITGEFSGDDMKAWLDRQGPERAAVFKRAK
jgi:hypothetical protein